MLHIHHYLFKMHNILIQTISFYVRENFLQLDLYYEELSCEMVSQHVAFEFLSLLSEIGGFLGLLLGASVLTVCEIIDYLVMSLLRVTRKGKTQVQAWGEYNA